jgi:putative Holliday junction resolvase
MTTRIHKRILGLDVGDKRIGMAVSDEMGITAQPAGTLVRSRPSEDFEKIIEIAKQYEVALIVVGLPMRLNGTDSPQTVKVREFLHELQKHTDIPVQPWDERLTTKSAEKIVDSVAAQFMLQHHLDCHRTQTGNQGEV